MFDCIAYIADDIATWPSLMIEDSRYGGLEFSLNTRQIGHLHENGMLSVSLPKALGRYLVAAGKAESHLLYPESGWVSFSVNCKAAVHHGLWLLRLAYVNKLIRFHRAAPEMVTGAEVIQEVRKLHLDDQQTALLFE